MLDTTAPTVDLDRKLNDAFPGRVVRKDLTQRLKEGANVPVYVLEYLLGTYCATDDELAIQEGVTRVKKILADNYVRPDEAERVKSRIREQGRFTVIDRVTVTLNDKADRYEALLMNLGVKDIVVDSSYVTNFEKLLGGGIWCILSLEYDASQKPSPFVLASLKPVQMPSLDLEEVFAGRKAFTLDEWIDVLLRSIGLEPTTLSTEAKWHLIARMVPLIENNYNSCELELGPRSTGKSHIYKEISPNTILVSGGQTTVANLFYNMSRQQVGLVGLWDVVAFDEVAEHVPMAGEVVAEVHGHEAGELEEARVHAPPCAGVGAGHGRDDVLLEPGVRALGGERVDRRGRLARVDGAAHHGKRARGGRLPGRVHEGHGRVAGHGRLADCEHVAAGAHGLQEGDQHVDIVVEVETPRARRHHLGVAPVGDVDVVPGQEPLHRAAQQRGVVARHGGDDEQLGAALHAPSVHEGAAKALELPEGVAVDDFLSHGHLAAVNGGAGEPESRAPSRCTK